MYQKYSGYLRKMDLQESNKLYNYDSRHLNRRETAAQNDLTSYDSMFNRNWELWKDKNTSKPDNSSLGRRPKYFSS